MDLYSSLLKYVRNESVELSHPLFTYFNPKYVIYPDGKNPYIKVSLETKGSGLEVLSYLQYHNSNPFYSCAFTDEKDLSPLYIIFTY